MGESSGDPVMTTEEAAAYLKLSVRTLERRRAAGEGPPVARIGQQWRYRRTELDRWLAEQETDERLRAWWRNLPPEERIRLRALHGKVVDVQEQLPAYILEEEAVRERLVDTGSGMFLLPGILADEEDSG